MVEVLKICHIGEIKVDYTKMSNCRIALVDITNKVPNSYNINEGWIVKKMKPKYVNRIVTILPIIYQKIWWNTLATNLAWWFPKQITENYELGYNHVFLVGQRVDQRGQMSTKHDWKNCQERAQEGCMPLCYYFRSFVSKMVSNQRNRTIGEEKAKLATTRGEEEERDYEGKVYKKQETFEPCTYLS